MTSISTGDLSRSLLLRRQTNDLKTALVRQSQEMTTGRLADPKRSLRGDVTALAALERSQATLRAYASAASECATFAEGQQSVLQRLSEEAQTTTVQLLSLGPGTEQPPELITAVAVAGRGAFETAVQALNTQLADRSLFAGAGTDGPALAPAEDILAALQADVAGITSPAALEAAVVDWFGPGGGFETVGLLAHATSAGPVSVSPDDRVALTVTAAREELRPLLSGLALTALVADGPAGATTDQRIDTLKRAGDRLFTGQPALVGLAGELGGTQARIARAQTRVESEIAALDVARTDLIGVDPFEAATKLEDTRGRIEALFTVTARLQRLTLTEFLR